MISGACAAGARETGSPWKAYVQARAAGSFGASHEAAKVYAAALAASPGSQLLAARTFNEAVLAGDRSLALHAARTLERSGQLSAEVGLLLLGEALRKRDWKRATLHVDAIEKDKLFGFMAPVLRSWTALGARKGDPLSFLAAAESNPLSAAYAREHRPLLLLAGGQHDQGSAALLALTGGEGLVEQRLRIAAAALLARKGKRDDALKLIAGDAPALISARGLLQRQRPLPAEISSASAGIAEFMVRIAGDLYRQRVSDLALRMARLSTFLAPENSETWLVTADLLGAEKRPDAALAALGQVHPSDPFAEAAQDMRIRLLTAAGRQQQALALAQSAIGKGGTATEWTRLGMLYAELDRQDEAAEAFRQALALRGQGPGAEAEWTLRLLRGGALEEAGRWPEAKTELEAAYKLAPGQAVVLNYLGYAQLERRENVEEATKLIAEASRLEPDSPEITDSLGWAYFLRGDLAKAVELLERAAAAAPSDPEINEHLGDAYYKAGRRFEGRYAWKAALVYAEGKDSERLRAKIEAGLTPELASP